MSDRCSPSSVLSLFAEAPLGARWHVRGRWRLFPFPRLLDFVVEGEVMVDLGCGYGLWALYLACAYPQCRVLAFDPDGRKIEIARKVARQNGVSNVQFEVCPAEEAMFPVCSLVSLIDVLYLIPGEGQQRVLAQAARRLSPGGRLLLKVMSPRPRWKFVWNWLEEWLAVRVLGLTMGAGFTFRGEQEWLSLVESLGLRARRVRLDKGYLHPHLLIVGEKPR